MSCLLALLFALMVGTRAQNHLGDVLGATAAALPCQRFGAGPLHQWHGRVRLVGSFGPSGGEAGLGSYGELTNRFGGKENASESRKP